MNNSVYYNRLVNDRGSTLIEILVTIFVLTSGLLVLFGMFPQGFSILQNSRNVGFAGGLNKDKSSMLNMRMDNMPFAIIPATDDGNANAVINENPNEGKPTPFLMENGEYVKNGDVYVRGQLLNCRKVVGESTLIPGGDYYTTANGEFYGGKYTLLFGPIDTTRNSGNKKLKRFLVYGSPMTNKSATFSDYAPDTELWNDAGYCSYWTPQGDGMLYLAFAPYYSYTKDYGKPMDYNRVYKISYMVRHETTGQIFKKEGFISVPDNYDGKWSNNFQDYDIEENRELGSTFLTQVGSGYVMLTDTLELRRVFQEIVPGKSFSSDPYQFMMADPVVGTLMFNPLGSEIELGNDGEKEPLKAFIDYMIYDPRIAVKDIQFPRVTNGMSVKLNLGLGAILSAGDPDIIGDGSQTSNPDEETFEGLIRGTLNAGSDKVDMQIGQAVQSDSDLVIAQSVLIIDTQSGLRVFPKFMGDEENPGDIEIDYSNGVVTFNTENVRLVDWYGDTVADNVSLTDRVLRFYFRTADDWVVRICKLPTTFNLSTKGVDYNKRDSLGWDEYGFIKNGDRIYFAQGYAGGDVVVDYVSKSGTKYMGKVYRISDYPEEDNEASCYIDLGRDAKEIISVHGASVIMGAYWRSGDGFRSRSMLFDVYGK